MTKQVNLDEMLDILRQLKHPLHGEFKSILEAAGTAMARIIADKLDVKAGAAVSEEPAFAGTCARFWPKYDGQECPTPLVEYDQGEWDEETPDEGDERVLETTGF